MTAPHIVDPAGLLGEAVAGASPDLMRSLLQSIINALLSADADAVVPAMARRRARGVAFVSEPATRDYGGVGRVRRHVR